MLNPDFIILRAEKNTSHELLDMLKIFKVPVGLSIQEVEQFDRYYAK